MFTTEQRLYMLQLWWKHEKNISKVLKEFSYKYPGVSLPTRQHLRKLNLKFEKTGSVLNAPKCGRPRSIRNEGNLLAVAEAFVCNPDISARKLASELSISRRSVQRMIKECCMPNIKSEPLEVIGDDGEMEDNTNSDNNAEDPLSLENEVHIKQEPNKETTSEEAEMNHTDGDKDFLMSLLPEMKGLTGPQKLEFKAVILRELKRIKNSEVQKQPTIIENVFLPHTRQEFSPTIDYNTTHPPAKIFLPNNRILIPLPVSSVPKNIKLSSVIGNPQPCVTNKTTVPNTSIPQGLRVINIPQPNTLTSQTIPLMQIGTPNNNSCASQPTKPEPTIEPQPNTSYTQPGTSTYPPENVNPQNSTDPNGPIQEDVEIEEIKIEHIKVEPMFYYNEET